MDKLGRRLAAAKVIVDLLNHELDLSKADRAVSLERERLEAVVTTLEMFIEDAENLRRGGVDDRRVVETARPAPARAS
jgi:hypothetical protein